MVKRKTILSVMRDMPAAPRMPKSSSASVTPKPSRGVMGKANRIRNLGDYAHPPKPKKKKKKRGG